MTNLSPRPGRSVTILLSVLTAVSLHADNAAPSVEERLARLESAIARIEARLDGTATAAELAPAVKEYGELTHALGWDGKSALTAVKPAGKEKSLAVGGFIHANFESGSAPDSRFNGINNRFFLRRARLYVAGTYAEDVSFKLESDFGNNSLAAKTGDAGQLTDAYVSWTRVPEASVRVGQFKTPFGFEQLQPDTKIYTIERSLSNDSLTVNRQIGAMVYGDLADKRLNYSVGAFNGTGVNTGGNDNQKFLWAGRLAGTVFDTKAGNQAVRLTTGVDYFTTEDKGTFTGRRDGSGLDAQLVIGAGELQAEWLENEKRPVAGPASIARGWELLGAYNLGPKWQAVVRYESYDANTAAGNSTTTLWTYGVNYLLKGDDLKLSLNYLSGDQPAPAPHGDRLIGKLQLIF